MNLSEYRKYKEEFRKKLDVSIKDDNLIKEVENSIRPVIGKIPNSFFRYRTLNMYTLNEIISSTVYLAEPKSFDDVFDSKCFISEEGEATGLAGAYLFSECLKSLDTSGMLDKNENSYRNYYKVYEEVLAKMNEMIEEKLRIACFTQKNDNIPMWYYYADEHKGICIEYDFSELESFEKVNYLFMPVIYAKNNEINTYKLFYKSGKSDNVIAVRNALVKSKDWSFEKEWRMIKFIKEEEKVSGLLQNIVMKKIYFGMQTPEEAKKVVSNIIQKNNLKIELYDMHMTGMGLKPMKYSN